MADNDDIGWINSSMPVFPDELTLWQRVRCVLGYHKSEIRRMGGKPDGLRLRDQCARCGALMEIGNRGVVPARPESVKKATREALGWPGPKTQQVLPATESAVKPPPSPKGE